MFIFQTIFELFQPRSEAFSAAEQKRVYQIGKEHVVTCTFDSFTPLANVEID